MMPIGRFVFPVLLSFRVLAGAPVQGGAQPVDDSLRRAREMAGRVTIVRDEFGVPHVRAATDAGAVFGAMYARAEDEMARIENAHALAIGNASLMLGTSGVTWDRFVLAFEVPTLARREYDSAPADVRAIVDAAADALNLYLSLHPDYRPTAIERWEPWMFMAREYGWAMYQAQHEAQRAMGEKKGATAWPSGAVPAPDGSKHEHDGSNAWAIGPSRTASGRPMLYINPHIPLDEPYEMHLQSDQGLNISGGTAYGAGLLPFAGFNEHLGWALTVNYPDIADTYAVEFNIPENPLGYRHGDQVRHATRWSAKIPVRTDSGIQEREFSFLKTHHGPVLFEADGKSYAVRVARIENLRSLEQWYRMAKARDLASWREAVSILGVVFHNLVYADADGNIGYVYNAAVPRRDPAFQWTGTLDGSDPRTQWQGYHSLDELPQVWNPACGYVQNCNSPPLLAAAEGQNQASWQFPAYMIGNDLSDGRIAMSHAILSGAKDWTLDDLERTAFDTTVRTVETSRAPLMADFARVLEKTPDAAERLAPAIELLRTWDGLITTESVESTLFVLWIEKLFSPAWVKRRAPGDLTGALAQVLADLEGSFGDWRVKWGQINRHQRFDSAAGLSISDERQSLPIAGAHGGMGVSFCYLSRASGTKHRYGYHGHSYVGAVEFGDFPSARTIIPFGQSRDPASAHFADQAPLYAAGRLKSARFSEKDVREASGRPYHPGH